ncbi:imidazole glycerol phosphate synthase subunit HisH [Ferruginibacter sp. HRS2-29]|uniref:imidazole glycerol phosphate synthase subunit HisH n=1 Tax=Ferruginibacter sp. HRS2-29 TaxID=2487334 RepID=UPI0020CC262B|nr:imidazole glycerol phosphate synthase subunit HisH [Ferruginibacter sp. HRS2-29]MCP9749870.1 imidazole glycerol phosphate synthase subunit HisH [Ferruginibacter sp. HRS2-29]
MKIAVIDYDAGNVQSVMNALQRLGVESFLTDDTGLIREADKVIFPGVGHAAAAMQKLRNKSLDQVIVSLKQPVLGICLGLQLLCRHSEEGNTGCLGIFDTAVRRFELEGLKVPQVGWNNIFGYASPLFDTVKENGFVYCVHSYYAEVCSQTVATTEYGIPYSAALQKDNFYAVQFHPEKSGSIGEMILQNFLSLV